MFGYTLVLQQSGDPALVFLAVSALLLGVPLFLLLRKLVRGELHPSSIGAQYAEGYADGRESDEDES